MGKTNKFGDVRAEHDHDMLETSFHESQNYRTLIESKDRFIVVGRRGTGKSALTYRLSRDWASKRHQPIIIAPSEEQVIGLRPAAQQFGASVSHIRAGLKLGWRYALLLEIAKVCESNYKTTHQVDDLEVLKIHLKRWKERGSNIFERLKLTFKESLKGIETPEERISDLSSILQLNKITEEVKKLTSSLKNNIVVLIDRLDEGYEADTIGIGIVDGIIYGTDDIRNTLGETLQAIVFLRDNIFRAVQKEDLDFSRNLEGQVLRLHWDPDELFYMVCKRIRIAFNIEMESDVKVWNAITDNQLHGRESFKRCLRFTLYRPRDVISLLNSAIEIASRKGRTTLIESDFTESSKHISSTRFDDLRKEYNQIFPGIGNFTLAFANGPSQLTTSLAESKIQEVTNNPEIDASILQHYKILGSPRELVNSLYGVGFIGKLNIKNNTWVFSHDGKQSENSIIENDLLMIHPCYWSALNLQRDDLDQAAAEQIYDEYEITIYSQSTEQRATMLGQIISDLNQIPHGSDGANAFENWCKRAIEIAFAQKLTNIQLHPNGNSAQRRDIVATNQGVSGYWKRVRDDYKTRQVIFEVKNYEEIGINEYRQTSGYLTREYGRLGFIICRDRQQGLTKGRDLDAFKEFYIQEKTIIKLTTSFLTNILSKLRNPSKIDIGDTSLENILDTHIRLYANGQGEKRPHSSRKK